MTELSLGQCCVLLLQIKKKKKIKCLAIVYILKLKNNEPVHVDWD